MTARRPLDRIDAQILAALQNDARHSNKALAAAVNLSPSSCLERVRRLEREGTLRGYRADVDPAALGITLEAMVFVRLAVHAGKVAGGFTKYLDGRPEVVAWYHLSGEDDFMVQAVVRDVDHLRRFTVDGLTARKEVGHVRTALVFERGRRTGLPDFVDRPR